MQVNKNINRENVSEKQGQVKSRTRQEIIKCNRSESLTVTNPFFQKNTSFETVIIVYSPFSIFSGDQEKNLKPIQPAVNSRQLYQHQYNSSGEEKINVIFARRETVSERNIISKIKCRKSEPISA